MEKMTNVKAINYVVENFAEELPTDVLEKLNAIKASFIKKSENRKPTKTQKENEDVKALILANLTTEGTTVTDIMAKNAEFGAFSNQKISALLAQLVKEGKAVKTIDKKKSLFALAA